MSHTFRDAVEEYFTRHANQWLDGMAIAQVGGCYAYRTRISECRTQRGMAIENRLRKVGQRTISEYRYTPSTHDYADLLHIAEAS